MNKNSKDFVLPANIEYDPLTGELWRVWETKRKLISYTSHGYICVNIEKQLHRAHRLIWFIETGAWSENEIDHIDGDTINNRFINLREATRSENTRNSRTPSTNTSGVKGAFWDKASSKWKARINISGRTKSLGSFYTLQEAENIVRAAREKHHKRFCNHGVSA